jgi:hypothetical protein
VRRPGTPLASQAAILAGGAVPDRRGRWWWVSECLTRFGGLRAARDAELSVTARGYSGRGQTGIGPGYPGSVGLTRLGHWTR